MWLLLACAPPAPTSPESAPRIDTLSVETAAPDTATAPTDSADTIVFDEAFDVVVVGAGPAGIAAALSAREAGASVLLLDRDETPGDGLLTGTHAFAIGTRWQEELGVEDSVALAQADWADITGGDPTAAGVVDFLENSAATLEWLEGYGLAIDGVYQEHDAGPLPRVHQLDWSAIGNGTGLHAAFDGELRAGVEVTAPVMAGGAVVGVAWTDVATGTSGTTGAGAVVLATGGFLRNREEVDRVVPSLAGRRLVYETNLQSDGGGLPFLDAVGAARMSSEQIGIYVHSIEDPELPGESLLAIGVEEGILVGADGARFVDEGLQSSFDLFDALPPGDVFEVLAGEQAMRIQFMRPAYNWSDVADVRAFALADVAETSTDVFAAGSLADAAAAAGIDAETLEDTVAAWNLSVATGTADPYGRNLTGAHPLEGESWLIVRLTPGLAKNFGGVATDADGHVLDGTSTPIPGLYAAGEVAGMLLGGGGGDGFAGSVNACFWGGRVAGGNAAAEAMATP